MQLRPRKGDPYSRCEHAAKHSDEHSDTPTLGNETYLTVALNHEIARASSYPKRSSAHLNASAQDPKYRPRDRRAQARDAGA